MIAERFRLPYPTEVTMQRLDTELPSRDGAPRAGRVCIAACKHCVCALLAPALCIAFGTLDFGSVAAQSKALSRTVGKTLG
jgi:hypothetical protein